MGILFKAIVVIASEAVLAFIRKSTALYKALLAMKKQPFQVNRLEYLEEVISLPCMSHIVLILLKK